MGSTADRKGEGESSDVQGSGQGERGSLMSVRKMSEGRNGMDLTMVRGGGEQKCLTSF